MGVNDCLQLLLLVVAWWAYTNVCDRSCVGASRLCPKYVQFRPFLSCDQGTTSPWAWAYIDKRSNVPQERFVNGWSVNGLSRRCIRLHAWWGHICWLRYLYPCVSECLPTHYPPSLGCMSNDVLSTIRAVWSCNFGFYVLQSFFHMVWSL